jgi:protein-L-isoaspartate O-methyltransferase
MIHAPAIDLPRTLCSVLTRRLLRAVHASVLLVLALFGASPTAAIGPETPVDFLDVYAAKGFMLLVIEPKQIASLEVIRIVHQDGEPLGREPVEWKRLRMFDYIAPITGPGDFQYRDPKEQRKHEINRLQSDSSQLPSIDSAQLRPDLSVIDVGSGSGALAIILAEDGAREVVGVDTSPAMLENSFSSGVATADAIVSGFAPGSAAWTWSVGKSTLGRSLTGSAR